MDNPSTSDTGMPEGAFTPVSTSDAVLGYPETVPPGIDLGPVPSGVGAKPSAKTASAPEKRDVAKPSAPPTRSGPPLPKRPKGRLFIGSMFLFVLIGAGTTIFNTMLRYTAYGEVTGRRIDLAVPWSGVVQSIHVRDGDRVQPGDLIARIDSLEMRQKIEEIDDSLRLERARLSSELAMLRWEAEKIRDTRKLSLSEFYDKWSQLLWEQSRLVDLRMQVKRVEPLQLEGAASEEHVESLRYQLAGQEKRVEQLTEAVRALKQRSDESPIELALEDRVQPTLTRIENLQSELHRTREMIREGEIRAPAAGRIIRTLRFIGEYADQSTPVAELFVEGSTELVLYLPQDAVEDYPIGRTVTLHDPAGKSVNCEVERVAMEMQKAPDSLARYYRLHESLLPVYLRMHDGADSTWLALGSEVRLPRSEDVSIVSRLKGWWNGHPSQGEPERANPLRSEETLPSVRTVRGQDVTREPADKELIGRDGRTAGWIQKP